MQLFSVLGTFSRVVAAPPRLGMRIPIYDGGLRGWSVRRRIGSSFFASNGSCANCGNCENRMLRQHSLGFRSFRSFRSAVRE